MTNYGPYLSWNRPLGGQAHPADQQVLLRYLLAVGLIEAELQTDPYTMVFDYSRSHRVWLVQLADGRRLLVKRARAPFTETHVGLGAEALVYQLAANLPDLSTVMPACLWSDPLQHILVLEAVQPGENLHVHHYLQGPSVEFAEQLAGALAGYHRATVDLSLDALPQVEVGVLNSLTPTGWRPWLTNQVLVQGSVRRALATKFAAIKELLRPTCLTHGDMKWGNCLTATDGIRVIDWELAGIGDPAWDVAGLLHEYVALPCVQQKDTDVMSTLALCIGTILETYRREAPPLDPETFWHKAALLTGARLVQTAFEHASTTPHAGYVPTLVERGLEIMETPETLFEGGIFQ